MMKYLWSVGGIGLYLYVVCILTQYGFYSYFNIPYNFIDASLVSNVIYYFQIVQVGQFFVAHIHWYSWLILAVLILGLIFVWEKGSGWRFVLKVVGTGLFLLIAFNANSFGQWLAENATSFDAPQTASCISPSDPEVTYVIPGYHGDGQGIFIPIASSTNKMTGGYLTRDVSQIPCKIVRINTGKITK